MRVPPANQKNLVDRQVELSEYVDMRVHSMTDTQMTTVIEPSMHAQRLECMMRDAEIPTARTRPVVETSRCTRVYKRTCDTVSLVCGVAAFPAFALVVLGPVWLAVPAGLLVVSAASYFLRGTPTQEMEQEYAVRRVSAQANDCQGV